jgi:uncharacterized membrane protein
MRVKLSSRLAAALSYPALVVGAVLVAALRPRDAFARAHAKTSAGLSVFCALAVAAWFAAMELLSFIPYAGFPIAIALGAIVAAAVGYCCLMAFVGIIRSLLGAEAGAPLVDSWFDRSIIVFKRLTRPQTRRGGV